MHLAGYLPTWLAGWLPAYAADLLAMTKANQKLIANSYRAGLLGSPSKLASIVPIGGRLEAKIKGI